MAPASRRRPATAGGGDPGQNNNATKDKAPLAPAGNGSPGSPVVVSPRGGGASGGGGGGVNASHHHHHKHQNQTNQNLTSLDLDALDDEEAAARFDSMSESVVKIFCIHSEPAFNQPW